MSKRGRGGACGAKFRISLALPVGAIMNCADNTGGCIRESVTIWGCLQCQELDHKDRNFLVANV